eukprot:TRINITY_DN1008_c0_g1_i1.p1 TRINITY_DN1008_c0_g1~~TRINITY_DN1008_c0_g1_i1.p1  ORF type:complete len:594 (-),score=120.51 TRINITY_DN1008_c0_g1_i1:27-1808(-)
MMSLSKKRGRPSLKDSGEEERVPFTNWGRFTSGMCNRVPESLCRTIIEDHFGFPAAEVYAAVLRRGSISLQVLKKVLSKRQSHEVKPATNPVSWTHERVSMILLTLVQHNVVTFVAPKAGGAFGGGGKSKIACMYTADMRNTLLRPLFPMFAADAKKQFGSAGEAILLRILADGRLSLSSAKEKVVDASLSEVEVAEALGGLVTKGFICRVPMPSSGAGMRTDLVYGRGGAATKSDGTTTTTTSLLGRGTKRKLSETASLSSSSSTSLVTTTSSSSSTALSVGGGDNPVMRVNFDRFLALIRRHMCIRLIREKLGDSAGSVLDAAFLSTHDDAMELDVVPVTLDAIMSIVSSDLRDPKKISSLLDVMAKDSVRAFTTIGGHSSLRSYGPSALSLSSSSGAKPRYELNISNIVDAVKRYHVETIIAHKAGQEGLRIYRLLQAREQAEQKQIAELAMVPIKLARSVLYKMLKYGYLHLQEVPRTPDHAAARTLYFWSVRNDDTHTAMIGELSKTVHNIILRRQHEKKNHVVVVKALEQHHKQHKHQAGTTVMSNDEETLRDKVLAGENSDARLERSIQDIALLVVELTMVPPIQY